MAGAEVEMTTTQPAEAQAQLEVRDLKRQLTACVRLRIKPDELSDAFPAHLPRIASRVRELGGAIAGPPYARYFHWGWDVVEVEIGAPIAGPIPDLPEVLQAERGDVASSELPAGRAAVLVHQGPYGQLGDSWSLMEELMAREHLLSAACGWEHYVDDPDIVPPQELRTELVHPVV
jgi:AraC family transcriptional regulator